MADLQIGDELLAALRTIAAHENLSVETLLNTLLERYRSEKNNAPLSEPADNEGWRGEALDNFIGMFNDDIPDLSESIHDSVASAIRKKYARSS